MKNMRKHFFIDKSLQTHYALYFSGTLFVVIAIAVFGIYFGIWGSVIESFSEAQVYQEIKTAARIQDYEHAREPEAQDPKLASLRLFKEIDLLSARQRDQMDDILKRVNRRLMLQGLVLVILIGFGSIYLTHKIAGPLFHFRKSMDSVKKGELTTRVYLRKHDEAMSVANTFNEMMKSLDDSVSNLKRITREADSAELKIKLEQELNKFKTSNS